MELYRCAHAVQAMPRALEASFMGGEDFATANSILCHPRAELVAKIVLAVVPKDGGEPIETFLPIEKATRMLGYQPRYR